MFIGFVNFYQRFIRGFNKIAAPLTLILKTIGLFEESAPIALRAGNDKVVKDDSSRTDKMVVDSSKSKNEKFQKLIRISNIKATRESNFLTSNAKKVFNHLRLAFIKP